MSSNLQIPWARWEQSGRVGARAELQDVRLFQLSSQLKDFGARGPFVADLNVTSGISREVDAKFAVVNADYVLKALTYSEGVDPDDPESEATEEAAEVKLTMVALFSIEDRDDDPEPLADDELEAFAESTGLAAIHPYARELVQDQTARMGLPSLTMGVARIAK
jgi:hypothetical protein